MSGIRNVNRLANVFFAILAFLLFSQVAISADTQTGTIKGKVNYCGKGGYLGMQVFIPGRQFMAFLGAEGDFVFEEVPAGNYDINYVINGKLVNENKNVSVSVGGTNDLGSIEFCNDVPAAVPQPASNPCEANPDSLDCVDADKDGVVASRDCNDNDAAIKPGAVEKCDGVDNNCNGKIDEESIVNILNGTGHCDAGKVSVKACNKGFANCDKDSSNGCETDTNNDHENCGRCGNACSPLDSCNLGIC